MIRPSRRERGSAAATALFGAFLVACTSNLEGPTPNGAGASSSAGNAGDGSGTTGGTGGSSGDTGQGGGVTAGTDSVGGTSGAGAAGGTGPIVNPPPFQPAAGMLRRLTRTQFRNAVLDVFGFDVDVNQLEADSFYGSVAVIGAATVVTAENGVEQYHAAIEGAANALFADAARRSDFIGCTPTGAASDACIREFIAKLGRRAWRRPLEAVEVDRLAGVAAIAATELGSAVEGARWATVALFTSPNFLYRPELGAAAQGGSLRFTDYEQASRLAFLVWNSLPDDTLLDQAESGMLATPGGLRSAVERLLDAPAGRRAIGAFAEEYMRLDRLSTQAKDSSLYPEYGPALQAAMIRDMKETWEVIAFDDRTSAMELFTTTKVVVNADLARLYGLDAAGLGANTFQVLSLPADSPRVGILGKAGFLSQFANQKEGSPTLRGKFMREALMCTPVEPPPGDVDIVLEDPPADQPMTKRQRLELHRTDPACAGCHYMMDPLGLPLETFDAIGRYRTLDRGLPIDPSGDFDGEPVADARDLGRVVAASETVTQCLVRKYYSYAMGYEERDVDGSVVNALVASFEASGQKLRDLILDVVSHEAFSSVAPQP